MSRVETSPGVGAVLAGRYRLDARVGVGRTGTVFRAFDQALNTTVAVKVLNPGPFTGSDRAINVFRVNRVLAYRHDGLVRVQDVCLVPTAASRVLFLVEDWIDGRSFDAYIRGRNPLQNWEILEAFRQLSSALGFIHKIGVHGNLTPANVLVVDGRRLVLTDCYDVLGLPPPEGAVAASFRAPELADTTSGREDPASDIWSLGMMLGMALLRSPVHPGVRLSAQGPGVPYEADAVFLRATERDPRRRFGGVDEMVDAMRMALPGEPAVVEAVGFVGRQRSEVSITAETRTAGAATSTRRPSALQVAPDEALDWVDESSPEIDWTDVETVAEWADEAGDWSAAEVVDDAAIESLDLDDATVLVEVDAVVPAPLPAPTPAPIAAPAPTRTPTVPARTPTVPSRARSRTAPGFDSTDSGVTPQLVDAQSAPAPEPSPAPESVAAPEPAPAPEPVAASEPALATGDELVLDSEPTLELVAPAASDDSHVSGDVELEPGPDTIETIAEPAPLTPRTVVDDEELALAALTAPSAASEPLPPAELDVGGLPEAPPSPPESDVAAAEAVVVDEVSEGEFGDTLEITPEAPPELTAAEEGSASAVPPLLVDDDIPERVEVAPAPPPVPLDDDDESPSPTLEVPMTFRSDAPPLVLDLKPTDPVPPPTLPVPPDVLLPTVSTPAPVPVSTPASPPAVDDRGKGKKKKNKQKGAAPATSAPPATVAAPPTSAAVVAAPVAAAAAPAAPAPASAVASAAPVVPSPVAPVPVVPSPVAAAPVVTKAPAVAVAPAAPPPPSAQVFVAKAAASAAPRPAPNTAVIATPKVPSASPSRPAPAPANKPMSWGVVLIGGFAAVIGIAVLVWLATSNKQSTPKVQKAVSVAPAAPVGGALAPATPATESGALAAQAGSMDVSAAAVAAPDAGSPEAPDTSITATPLTAVALDAGADVALVADDVAALDSADVPDVSDALDAADTADADDASPDTADAATALVAADDVLARDSSDVAVVPDAAVAEAADTTVAEAPDVPAIAAVDAQVGTDAVAAGGVDLRFIPPELLACPTGMAKLSKKMKYDVGGQKQDGFETYCIDRREFPGAGMPRTGVGLYAAKGACERKGGRLCSGAEWRRGCGGTYPYGSTFDESRCNTMTLDGTSREVVATGSFGRCKSGSGLSDMVGNVAEWTADGMVRGGDAYKTGQEATCGFARRRAPDSGSPHVGFRCCADPVLGDAPAEESP